MKYTNFMESKFAKNYKINIEPLGDIILNNVSLSDLIKYENYKLYDLHGKEFVINILTNQLINPRITLNDFINMNDHSIEKLARALLKHEDHYYELFSESGNFYDDFKKAFVNVREKLNKEMMKFGRKLARVFKTLQKSTKPCNKILSKYKWFISPSFPPYFITNVKKLNKGHGRKDKKINQLFISYFEANDWRNLELMVEEWKQNDSLKNRYKILLDCVCSVKLLYKNRINAANVILPTLVAQIDGFLSDFLNSKGIKYQTYEEKKNQLKKNKTDVLPDPFNDSAFNILLDVLFQKSQSGKPLEMAFNFNRHKINHGESTTYGRKVYMIRAFMILDLLSGLK